MFRFVVLFLGAILRLFRRRQSLLLENLVLRQQVSALKRKNPRPKLTRLDRCFWITVSRLWSEWKSSLLLVKPETVVEWHRRGFRIYWRLKSKVGQAGRKLISPELQQIIFRMASENPTWGAPRIHGELRMLGFDLSERTISRWMKRRPRRPDLARRWLTFLRNHREVIAAMDFFTVPTLTFHVLYGFFVLTYDRRRILHCNVTAHPTSLWIVQQLREAFPFETKAKYLIFDGDAKYGFEVPVTVRGMGIEPLRISWRSPWQNGVAERWVGSCRRELLDHVIPANERHLRRLLTEYVRYHHEDRTHLGLAKQTPNGRVRAEASGRVISCARLGGLHHRYHRAA
jgi:transposase InsO family protein